MGDSAPTAAAATPWWAAPAMDALVPAAPRATHSSGGGALRLGVSAGGEAGAKSASGAVGCEAGACTRPQVFQLNVSTFCGKCRVASFC